MNTTLGKGRDRDYYGPKYEKSLHRDETAGGAGNVTESKTVMIKGLPGHTTEPSVFIRISSWVILDIILWYMILKYFN